MSELLSEIGLRLAKVVLATLLGLAAYVVLVGPLGVPPSPQLALEAWIVGALIVLLVETGPF